MILEVGPIGAVLAISLASFVATLLVELIRRRRVVASIGVLWLSTGLVALAGVGPYFSGERLAGALMGLTVGALFLWGFQLGAGFGGRRLGAHERARSATPKGRPIVLVTLAVTAIVGARLRYGADIPLFADDLDEVRSAARQRNTDGQLLSGVLSLASVAGAWVTATLVIEQPRRPLPWLYTGLFLLLTFLGGSRNALLLGVVPPLLARLLRSDGAAASRPRRLVATWIALWIAILGMTAFVGLRTDADGVGPLGSAFERSQSGVVERGLNVTVLNLGGQYETLGRVLVQVDELDRLPAMGAHSGQVYPGLPLLFEAPEEQYLELTARVSSPYFQTVAGLGGRLVVDFGIVLALIAAVSLGLVLGLMFRRSLRRRTLESDLGAALVLYVVAFATYDFLPMASPAVAILYLLVRIADRTQVLSGRRSRTANVPMRAGQ